MADETPAKNADPVSSPAHLHRAIGASPLAVGLLHLPERRFTELSARAKELLGLNSVDLGELDVLTLSADPEHTARSWMLTAEGALDAYTGRRMLRVKGYHVASDVGVRVVGRDVGDPPACSAVVTFALDHPDTGIGNDVVPRMQSSGERLLASLLTLADPLQVCDVLTAFERALEKNEERVAFSLRQAYLTLRYLGDGQGRFGWELVHGDGPARCGTWNPELEWRLQRISDEIQAIARFRSVVPVFDSERVPGLRNLTPRQWEIVTRLLRGERVPKIARSMFLSQSTVRNHLSAIFRKIGVRSQEELITTLSQTEE